MIKISIMNKNKKPTMILINPDCIVSVEQESEDLFKVYLTDGRVLMMSQEMYDVNFEEFEEEVRS